MPCLTPCVNQTSGLKQSLLIIVYCTVWSRFFKLIFNRIFLLILGLVKSIHGSYKVKIHPEEGQEVEIDFTPPFRRIRMLPDLEKEVGVSLGKDFLSILSVHSGG